MSEAISGAGAPDFPGCRFRSSGLRTDVV